MIPEAKALGRLDAPDGQTFRRFLGNPRGMGVDVSIAWTPPKDPAAPGYLQRVTCTSSGLEWGPVVQLPKSEKPVTWRLSPDGNRVLYTIEGETPLHLADFSQAQPRITTLPLDQPAAKFDFLTGETHFYVTNGRGQMNLWPLGENGRALPDPQESPVQLPVPLLWCHAFSPDGEWLAHGVSRGYAAHTPEVNLVSLKGDESRMLPLPRGVCYAVAFSPDGKWLAAGGDRGVVSMWRTDDFAKGVKSIDFGGLPGEVYSIKFSPDGRHLVATGPAFQSRHWPLQGLNTGWAPSLHAAAGVQVMNVAVSPDNRLLAAACRGDDKLPGDNDGSITLMDVEGRASRVLTSHARLATDCAFSPDGKWFASAGCDGLTKVWEAAGLEEFVKNASQPPPPPRFTFTMQETRKQYARRLAFHPRGTLYCSTGDGVVFFWDLNLPDPGSQGGVFQANSIYYLLPDIAISPDGKWMAIARHGWDKPTPGSRQSGNQILLYDCSQAGTPKPITELRGVFIEHGNFAFSSDSRWLAAGGAADPSQIWDLQAPDIAASAIKAPVTTHLMAGIAFSADDQWLALAGSDGLIHLWDWRASGKVRTLQAGNHSLNSLCFLKDGRLAAAGAAPLVSVFDTDLSRLKDLARRVAGRTLTQEEIERFRVAPTR
jgi:WD40 repeat protein